MRVHSDTLSAMGVIHALQAEKMAGRIDAGVNFMTMTRHGSRTHANGFEIQLHANTRNNGRRAGNTGSYGAMDASDGYAATFDEWGWLIAALYAIDPEMIVGSPKKPVYAHVADFHHKTGMTYEPEALVRAIEFNGDPYPYVSGKGAKTKRGYIIGRRGAGRHAYWPMSEKPRTTEDVLEFARLTVKGVSA